MVEENPFAAAARILESFAWVEGQEPPFNPAEVEFSPEALAAWNRCVDAVAALPVESNPMSVGRRLKVVFAGTVSEPAGSVNGAIIWRWTNPPRGPWVQRSDLHALRMRAAEAAGFNQTPEPWQQSLVLWQVAKALQDLICWGEQPHSNPLPEGWAAAYRESISNAVRLAKTNFAVAGDEETVEFLRKVERLARDVITSIASSFSISSRPAAEWPEGYAERFQQLVKAELQIRELEEPFAAAERRNDRRRKGIPSGYREEGTNAAPTAPEAAPEFAGATDAVPAAYCEDGRPCGPLEGNATAILKAITRRDKVRPEDLKRLHGLRVWVRQITKRRLEVFFRSFKEFHAAEERLKPSEQPDNGG